MSARVLRRLSAFPITPADSGGRVDVGALRRLLSRLREANVDSVGILGSTGIYPYLSREERRRTVDAAVEEIGTRIPVLVGVGALRTDDAVRFAQDAKAAGASAGLLAPMSYMPLTDDEVFAHFETVAQESGLPLCIYDNPSTTNFTFSPDLIARVSRISGVIAAKSPAPEAEAITSHVSALRAAVPDGFSLGYSGDWNCVAALMAGADVWYSVLAGMFPEICVKIVAAAQSGDAAEARHLDTKLRPLWDLFKRHSSLRVMYAIAALLEIWQEGPPRPLLPLPAPVQQKIVDVLRIAELA